MAVLTVWGKLRRGDTTSTPDAGVRDCGRLPSARNRMLFDDAVGEVTEDLFLQGPAIFAEPGECSFLRQRTCEIVPDAEEHDFAYKCTTRLRWIELGTHAYTLSKERQRGSLRWNRVYCSPTEAWILASVSLAENLSAN